MKVIGITGGAGSGKTVILDYIEKKYGARVIQADLVGHAVMRPGNTCYDSIVEVFGMGVLAEDSTIDRSKLGRIVFADKELLEVLNRIIHPAVKEYIGREIEKERKKGNAPFMVIEAALLIEDNYDAICDELWYIYASDEVRKERLKSSRGYSDSKIEDLFRNQLTEEEYRDNCQMVIDNSNSNYRLVYEQIDKGLMNSTLENHI